MKTQLKKRCLEMMKSKWYYWTSWLKISPSFGFSQTALQWLVNIIQLVLFLLTSGHFFLHTIITHQRGNQIMQTQIFLLMNDDENNINEDGDSNKKPGCSVRLQIQKNSSWTVGLSLVHFVLLVKLSRFSKTLFLCQQHRAKNIHFARLFWRLIVIVHVHT